MRKNRFCSKLVSFIAILMVAALAITGCTDSGNPDEVKTSSVVESQSQSGVPVDPQPTPEAVQRDYRTQIKGGGEDVVTLMLYLCGSDLETRGAAATIDLLEIVMADLGETENLNIIVETGGAKEWATDAMDPELNQRWQVANNDIYLLESFEAKNMTKGSTLQDFITYSSENFPADRYMLVLWDHGGGTVGGYAYDERFNNDGLMPISELDDALAGAGVAFDMIGFDCCLMGTAETAFMVEKYADYMVASQRVEPGLGWHYTPWVEALAKNTSMPTAELGKLIVDSYMAECSSVFGSSELTLSVTDLTYVPMLFDALYGFLPEIQSELLEGDMFVTASKSMGSDRAMQTEYDLIDLNFLVDIMGGSEKLEGLMQQCIAYNGTNIDNYSGLCMYLPYTNLDEVRDALDICQSIGIDVQYQDFLIAFANIMLGGQAHNAGAYFDLSEWMDSGWVDEDMWAELEDFYNDNYYDETALEIVEKGEDWVLSMPPEAWSLITDVGLRMFYDDGEGYVDLGLEGTLAFDEDGDLPLAFYSTWLALNGNIVPFYQEVYTPVFTYGYVPIVIEGLDAELILASDLERPEGYVAGWRLAGEAGETQKGLFEAWEGMTFDIVYDYWTYEFEFIDTVVMHTITLDGKTDVVGYEYVPNGEYYGCFELWDIYQNIYMTETLYFTVDL